MSNIENQENETSIFADNSTLKEELLYSLNYEAKKTRNTIWIISLIIFLADLFAISVAGVLTATNFIAILLIPAIFFGLGFLAFTQQVVAMVIVAALYVAVLIYTILIVGGASLISGFLVKAVLIYLFIKGFQHAFEARKISSDLNAIG